MTKVARVIEPALSLATGFATLPSNSRLTVTNGDHMENALVNRRSFMIARRLSASLYRPT